MRYLGTALAPRRWIAGTLIAFLGVLAGLLWARLILALLNGIFPEVPR